MLNIKDFVKAISSAKIRRHVLVAYLSAALKTSEHLIRYNKNANINAQLRLRLLIMIPRVAKKSAY